MKRGFFGIGVYEPKFDQNVGTVLRSAACFEADWTFQVGGKKGLYRQASNTMRTERHMPHYEYRDLAEWLRSNPVVKTLVAIEDAPGAVQLADFQHPERAVYVLGREDEGLPPDVLAACDLIVAIPSVRCLNVAVAGSIVLYDRTVKA